MDVKAEDQLSVGKECGTFIPQMVQLNTLSFSESVLCFDGRQECVESGLECHLRPPCSPPKAETGGKSEAHKVGC